ncbi:RabGAP/TBC [Auriscalpium vulgare]|uniref:RabGAP/TBC n=1 Tax=Auriscalpium vulgare TaxID=40419 RepID=A0ACB8S6Y2_9AGAM|nr:RabGAP/TBC [Auriscalpium vulgare]
MAARPPPARPHIGLNPNHFSSYSGADWGEDDVWDSGSDSESPSASQNTWNRTPSVPPSKLSTPQTSPRPVPKPAQNGSSSTLAFSYTHVSAPSPSSYPPRNESLHTPKNGWTLVQKAGKGRAGDGDAREPGSARDADVEGDIVLGDLDPEFVDMPVVDSRPRRGAEAVRQDAEEIVNDPLHLIRRPKSQSAASPTRRSGSSSPTPEETEKLRRERSIKTNRRNKFVECLTRDDVDMAELRKLSWSGIPNDLRPLAWQLLLGYLPLPTHLRSSTLQRKRGEYQSLVELTFARGKDSLDQQIWHQIEIDVPRTRPGVPLWMHGTTQRCLERILYVWAIRHPASGYVQGINDLATPFFQVFMSAYIDADPEEIDPSVLPESVLNAIEADSFWCLSRLLDGIQDNYISAQPGIQRSVKRMAELVARIDVPLYEHLLKQNVEFMQFAFRWMNCLLMREISVKNTVRMWDTYLAEGPDAFSQFHLYVCSAFLVHWSEKLREMDFQGIIMFLQSLPTQDWTDHEIEMLLSQAFVLDSTWHNAQSHFTGK